MVFIFGANEEYDKLGYVLLDCKSCHKTTLFSVHQSKVRATFFFIPTFSVMQKHYLRCENCGSAFELKKSALKDYVAEHIINQQQANDFLREEHLKFKEHEKRHIISEYEKFREAKMKEILPLDEPEYVEVSIVCEKCHAAVKADMKFCPQCGKKIKFKK